MHTAVAAAQIIPSSVNKNKIPLITLSHLAAASVDRVLPDEGIKVRSYATRLLSSLIFS